MTETPTPADGANDVAPPRSRRPDRITIGFWTARILTGAILAFGALPKLTGQAGPLAEALGTPYAVVVAIGLAEVAAVTLLFVPGLALAGAALAAAVMFGAVGSHLVGPVGLEGDLGSMFPLALIALAGAVASGVLAWVRRTGCKG